MEVAALSPLHAWESFYVIVGSSAAALTGLQFVVIALGEQSRRRSTLRENAARQIATFATPTILHFCAVLFISATLTAPWHALSSATLVLAPCGAAGMGYVLIVVRRARVLTGYKPVIEDWLCHAVLPFIAYSVLLIGAIDLPRDPAVVLFPIGAASLLLLLVGIHNAWDTVTYMAVQQVPTAEKTESNEPAANRETSQ